VQERKSAKKVDLLNELEFKALGEKPKKEADIIKYVSPVVESK